MPFALAATLFFLSPFVDTASPVKIVAKPDVVYIERTVAGQELNLDFVLENTSSDDLTITEIEVSVFDRHNALAMRKFIDRNGVRPSIETVPHRELKSAQTLLVFNPFHTFPANIEIERLVCRFNFETNDGKKQYVSETVVNPKEYKSKTRLVLPVKGRAIIYDGHDFYSHHRRFDYEFAPIKAFGFRTNFMRYSYDFVPINEAGEMFRGSESNNRDYFGFGSDLYAVGAGKIVAVVDKEPDNRKFDETLLTTNQMVLFGNYVIIDHRNGEFSLYSHIKQGSATVKVGDEVRQDHVIAKMGASGSSKFPHLHYELQTGPDTNAEGLPSYFRDFNRIIGSRRQRVKVGAINSGDIVDR